jgi:hypothetical protein
VRRVPQGARRFTKIAPPNETKVNDGEECSDCAKHNSVMNALLFADKKCSVAPQ